jgi:phosphopantothenoylcysteine decarboxylase/phosphopantothenate--cysteine ligase
MGFAVAEALKDAGAETILISAPTDLPTPAGVRRISVMTAQEMHDAVMEEFPTVDIVVKAAAVADYRSRENAEHKIKKQGTSLTIELIPNPDILSELGEKKTKQILVGFAAETRNLIEHAQEKMQRKNVDMLVANDVTQPGAGFGSLTNIVSFLFPNGRRIDLPKMNKPEIARQLIQEVAALIREKE